MSTIRHWLLELTASSKREKDWRKEGRDLSCVYAGEKEKRVPFNILYSNTETLLPSLYSAIPRPVVDRRFKDEDPIGKAAAEAGRRGLEFQVDTNIEGYETYDEAMRSAVLDAILPGRGVTTIKYDAEFIEPAQAQAADAGDEEGREGEAPAPIPQKSSELVCTQARKWDQVRFGYATKWSNMPWVAFAEDIDKKEATRLFGAALAAQLKYSSEDEDDPSEKGKDEDDTRGPRETTRIWVIWSKNERKVHFVSEEYADAILKTEDDPLQLTGFYPMPRPLAVVEKSNDLTPTALYSLYKEQAEELNELTRRIKRIVRAIKAKGIYDAELGGDIKTLVEADDNELVPADKTSSLAAEKGLQNAIWFWPVEELIVVLRELMAAREACKAVIWEIMGIADIMRGQSQASETLGAQKIKQSWGSLRLKRMQKEVQRYARDLLRMMLEVMATKFGEETWAKMTGLPFLTEEQVRMAQAQLQAAGQAMEMAQMQAPPAAPPPPGQPPQPPQPNPALQQAQQAMQAAQAEMQKPKWADVLAMLQNDMQRAYRIDIETNSTVEPEAAEDQKNIAELMNAIAQFLNGVTPMIESGVMPFQAAQAMLLAIVRRYRFGTEIEDQIKAMKEPQPKDDGKAAAAQADVQKAQMEIAAREKADAAKAQADTAAMQMKDQQAQRELAAQMQRESQKQQADMAMEAQQLEAKRREKQAELANERQIAELKMRTEAETELKKAAMAGAIQVKIAGISAASAAQGEEKTAQKGEQSEAMMAQILETQAELLKLVAAPIEHTFSSGRTGTSVRKVA